MLQIYLNPAEGDSQSAGEGEGGQTPQEAPFQWFTLRYSVCVCPSVDTDLSALCGWTVRVQLEAAAFTRVRACDSSKPLIIDEVITRTDAFMKAPQVCNLH